MRRKNLQIRLAVDLIVGKRRQNNADGRGKENH